MDSPSGTSGQSSAGPHSETRSDLVSPESTDTRLADGLWSKNCKVNDRSEYKAADAQLHVATTPHLDTQELITGSTMDSPVIDTMRSPHNMELTPPSTPKTKTVERDLPLAVPAHRPVHIHRRRSSSDFCFDIRTIEFDTTDAQLLGKGAWSKVYKLCNVIPEAVNAGGRSEASRPIIPPLSRGGVNSLLTPPTTPQKLGVALALPHALAIKVAIRDDALSVFDSEARILTHLRQSSPAASEAYIVPFYGYSVRSRALIFQCAEGGTLDDLIASASSRSATETLDLFSTIAPQLIAALAFIHRSGVVHADIKPANILLDHDDSSSPPHIRARFADFSASFLVDTAAGPAPKSAPSSAAGGGTWAYMAPEQLVRDPSVNAPSFASDVYSLGITLLALLIGGDPFTAQPNMFMLREAVKMGDALNFAMQEPEFESRLDDVERTWRERGCEGRVVGLFKGVLRKKKEERIDAAEWAKRAEEKFA